MKKPMVSRAYNFLIIMRTAIHIEASIILVVKRM